MVRLSQHDAQEIANHRKVLKEEIYSQLHFQPVLDPISIACGRKSSVQELYENHRGKLAKEQIKRKVEEKASEVCTFHPVINSHSKKLMDQTDNYDILYKQYYQQKGYHEKERSLSPTPHTLHVHRSINLREPEKMAQGIRLHLLQKEEKRREELIMKEIYELQDCTFQPKLMTAQYDQFKTQFESPVVIPGLSRHLELSELSRKQKEEAALREKKVFSVPNIDKFRRPEDGSTIVESFQFHLDSPSRLNKSSRINNTSSNSSSHYS
jgi:hypothetical protein